MNMYMNATENIVSGIRQSAYELTYGVFFRRQTCEEDTEVILTRGQCERKYCCSPGCTCADELYDNSPACAAFGEPYANNYTTKIKWLSCIKLLS